MKSMDDRVLTIKNTISGQKVDHQETIVHFDMNEEMEPWISD